MEFKYNIIQVNGKNVLDRERKSVYNFTLQAMDRGTPPKSSITHLLIYINDVNDHKPEFEQDRYTVSISETIPVGSFVANLIATDGDSGINAELTYSIVSGNNNDWFKIDTTSGLVTTSSLLDFSVASQTNLNVSVHDGGISPFYDHATLLISIWDENNMVPTFDKSEVNVTIAEGLPSGTLVWVASAKDTDSGLNGTVIYAFSDDVEQQYPSTFSLNSQTGRITTTKKLDRETVGNYFLHIVARDSGTNPLSSTVSLTVNIEDKNDNVPYFYPLKYFENIHENMPIGTTVVKVTAFDADLGDNARIYYTFTQNYPQFSINVNTGVITTSQTLKKALKNSYTLIVSCRDTNTAHRATQNAIVEVRVTDDSDTAPVFMNNAYKFSIPEDNRDTPSSGRFVGTVAATGANSYAISAGNKNNVFAIGSQNGRITTSGIVDRELQSVYHLTVTASGGGKYASTNVEVTVTDINDNVPSFIQTKAEVNIYENWPKGQDVYHAEAIDNDDGLNALLSYTLQTASDLFQIRPNSGLIYLARNIEKSDGTSFSMSVTVRDSGSQQESASAQVEVRILDVNDHTPMFPKHSYEISLNESIRKNSQFYTLTATDADSGKNAEISYNITKGNADGKFGIFPDGKLFVAKDLDREKRDLYKLTVMAKDKGDNPRSSSVNITIHITDSNDNRPLFTKTSYQFVVTENLPAGQKIGYIRAQDADVGRNAEMSYFLAQSSTDFAIDVQTGEVTTLTSFDREKLLNQTGQEFIQFEAVAYDNGIPALQDTASISVTILDENDNAPRFSEFVYRAFVSEDAAIYSHVFKVTASDLDKDENGALTYDIIQGNDEQKFDIHPTSGQISLNGSIDMETQNLYVLVVMATDTGSTQKYSATATISVMLQDVNDNTPSFDQTSYSVRIPEDTKIGDRINVVMSATDVDVGVNSEVEFSLTGAGNDGTFKIDSHTGNLYLAKAVDYEVLKLYQMTVTATDKGVPLLSSDTRLTVNIEDVNDNSPEFVNLPNTLDVTENTALFTSILQISAQDRDVGSNGQVTYYIAVEDPPESVFVIQNNNLMMKKALDREKTSSYHLTIVATDMAMPVSERRSVEKTITIQVSDINDNAPRFTSPNAVMLNYPTVQGQIATIKAYDPDSLQNGEVIYSLLNGTDKFAVTSTTGELYLTSNLPQSPTKYTLKLKASDRAAVFSNRKEAETEVTILLHQSTRSGPAFQNLPYSAQIMENSATGSSVIQVSTSSQNVEFYISGVTSGGSDVDQYFVVDKSSGIIRTSRILDREAVGGTFTVTVSAVDTAVNAPAVSTAQVGPFYLDLTFFFY